MYLINIRNKTNRAFLSKKCKYYPILGKHNDGVIMDFIDKGTYEEEHESGQKIIVDSFVNKTAQTIKFGSVGSIYADNRHSHGY